MTKFYGNPTRDLLDDQGELAVYFQLRLQSGSLGSERMHHVGFANAWGATDAWMAAYQRQWDWEGPQ